jgi:hypothetical protein
MRKRGRCAKEGDAQKRAMRKRGLFKWWWLFYWYLFNREHSWDHYCACFLLHLDPASTVHSSIAYWNMKPLQSLKTG